MARPSVARIFAAHLRHNARRVRELASASRVMACVKADGYGHGILNVADAIDGEVDGYAVACIEEALALRGHGIERPILLLEGPHTADEVAESAQHNFTLSLSTWRQLDWVEAAPEPPSCRLKIDTGMHRLGFAPADTAAAVHRLRLLPGISTGLVLCSHFARADEPEDPFTSEQVANFDAVVSDLTLPQSLAIPRRY